MTNKQRLIIPGALIALAMFGTAACEGDPSTTAAKAPAGDTAPVAVEQTAAEKAAEATAAAAKAAADKAADAKEAAAKKIADARAAAEKKVAAAKQAAEKAAAAREAALTNGQRNASRAAENYLDMTGFSRKGLIDQLKFEGYTVSEATYGVDDQKANWNTQAGRSAKKYLEMTAFSRSGLIEQLMFEGYTRSQATAGVTAAGL
jgi:colicin import membrane protein